MPEQLSHTLQKPSTAIILAGGAGTRLRSVVSDRPKPMALVDGVPFLQHVMDYWIAQGISSFVLSVGYMAPAITDYFGESYRGCRLSYAVEQIPLGTGGGLLCALSHLKDSAPVLVLNGDTLFAVTLDRLATFHHHKKSGCSFCLFPTTGQTGGQTRYMNPGLDSENRLTTLHADNRGGGGTANGGVYLANPGLIRRHYNGKTGQNFSLEHDMFTDLLHHKEPLFGIVFDCPFLDIGLPDDYARAPDFINRIHST